MNLNPTAPGTKMTLKPLGGLGALSGIGGRSVAIDKDGPRFFRQFGGTGYDILYSLLVLPDGDLVASIRTMSTNFDGIDLSAYTDGSTFGAYGIIVINPITLKIKRSFWQGNGKSSSGGSRPFNIELVGTTVYFLWGSGGLTADWRVLALDTNSMTLAATSNTNMIIDYSNGILRYYGGNFYVAGYNEAATQSTTLYKLNASLAETARATISLPSWNPQTVKDMVVDASNIFYVTGTQTWPRHIVKCNLSLAYVAYNLYDNGGNYTGWSNISISQNAANLFVVANVSQLYYEHFKSFQKSNLAKPAAWTDWYRDLLVSGQYDTSADFTGHTCDANGRLWLYGYYKSTEANKNRMRLMEFNPTTGAVISEQYTKYASGAEISFPITPVAGWTQCWSPRAITPSGEYITGGSVLGDLPGFTVKGSYDAMVLRQNASGQMLG